MAPSGAPTRGPFLSSFTSGCRTGTPCTASASRRGVDEGLGALVDEPGLDQPVGDELAQILGRARLHARGDFLGEEFEQKVGHQGHAAVPAGSRRRRRESKRAAARDLDALAAAA